MGTEEDFQRFVEENRDLIEKMMALQKDGTIEIVSAGRDAAHEAERAAEEAKRRAEDFAKATYSMFTDPEVQRHFMAMGMELFMGISTMMQKAPVPDFIKETAEGTERSWRSTACRTNEDCSARPKPQRVDINTDQKSDGPTEIKVTDYSKEE